MSAPLLLTEWGWFWCYNCGRAFPCGTPPDEAKAEHDENFPGMTLETSVLLCDDCYKAVQSWFHAKPKAEQEAINHEMYSQEIERVIKKAGEG